MRKITKQWTCKDGTKIRICDLSDLHLQRIINMLERKAKNIRHAELSAAYSCSSMFSEDSMASFYCEQDIDSMEEDEDGNRFLPSIYYDLHDEKNRREIERLQRTLREKQNSELK